MAKVTMTHLRELGYCASGVREFFSRNLLDYPDFLANGIDSEELMKKCGEDHMVVLAVEKANGN
jgi:hypothetical protein